MMILITADLHYDVRRSRPATRRLAEEVRAAGGDVLVLAGDTAGAEPGPMREALALFADFPGRRLLVPGNHCLWCRREEDSVERYERILPALAAEAGFDVLDHSPVIHGGVGLVGSVGWYDYSFADESLGVPDEFYRAKVAPGAAEYLGTFGELLRRHRHRLSRRHYSMGARWMDGVNVKLPMSDEQFALLLADKLDRQLAEVAARVQRIVVFLHHLPFRSLVPRGRPDRFTFAAAYMGAERFGKVLLDCPKVTHVYCGHSHWPKAARVGGMNVVNVGSTYTDKRLEVLDL